MEASLSLEAILALLPALARDLQQEYLPWLGRTMQRLTALLHAGADSNADLLQVVFRCVSSLCKYLVRHIVSNPAPLLAATRPMRHHMTDHVRVLSGESVAYVLRQCAPDALQNALVVLLRGRCAWLKWLLTKGSFFFLVYTCTCCIYTYTDTCVHFVLYTHTHSHPPSNTPSQSASYSLSSRCC